MDEKLVLSKEELQELQEQQNQYNQTLFRLGSIELLFKKLEEEQNELKKEKNNLMFSLEDLSKKAEELQKSIVDKYGQDIEINLGTGELTKIQK